MVLWALNMCFMTAVTFQSDGERIGGTVIKNWNCHFFFLLRFLFPSRFSSKFSKRHYPGYTSYISPLYDILCIINYFQAANISSSMVNKIKLLFLHHLTYSSSFHHHFHHLDISRNLSTMTHFILWSILLQIPNKCPKWWKIHHNRLIVQHQQWIKTFTASNYNGGY